MPRCGLEASCAKLRSQKYFSKFSITEASVQDDPMQPAAVFYMRILILAQLEGDPATWEHYYSKDAYLRVLLSTSLIYQARKFWDKTTPHPLVLYVKKSHPVCCSPLCRAHVWMRF